MASNQRRDTEMLDPLTPLTRWADLWRDGHAGVTIRRATEDDRQALENLAALESTRLGPGPWLIGEVGDEAWAAVSLADFTCLGDPFRPSGELVFIMLDRARQLSRPVRHPLRVRLRHRLRLARPAS